jgi:hypothetical protein
MEIGEERVLDLACAGYLLARWSRDRLLIHPGIL